MLPELSPFTMTTSQQLNHNTARLTDRCTTTHSYYYQIYHLFGNILCVIIIDILMLRLQIHIVPMRDGMPQYNNNRVHADDYYWSLSTVYHCQNQQIETRSQFSWHTSLPQNLEKLAELQLVSHLACCNAVLSATPLIVTLQKQLASSRRRLQTAHVCIVIITKWLQPTSDYRNLFNQSIKVF